MEIIREGSWFCPNCNQKNRGAKEKCNACGAVRGNVQFIYEEDGEEITDEAAKKRATDGADWVCGFCGCSNAFDAEKCGSCAAARGDGTKRQVKDASVFGNKDQTEAPIPAVRPTDTTAHIPGAMPKGSPSSILKFGCLGLVLLFMALMGLECMSFEDLLEVTRLEWKRAVAIEQYQTFREEAWKNELPPRARTANQEQKVRSYRDVLIGHKQVTETYQEKVKTGTKRVKTGVKDLGNGRFKEIYEDQPVYEYRDRTRQVQKPVYRKDPIYDAWITFDVDRWTALRTDTTQGTIEPPAWPATGLSAASREEVGAQREGKKEESYKAWLKSAKKGKEYEVTEIDGKPLTADQFLKLRPNTRWKTVISGLGTIKEISGVSAPASH